MPSGQESGREPVPNTHLHPQDAPPLSSDGTVGRIHPQRNSIAFQVHVAFKPSPIRLSWAPPYRLRRRAGRCQSTINGDPDFARSSAQPQGFPRSRAYLLGARLSARGKLEWATLRAPSAGKNARDPRKTATPASPPERAGLCTQSRRELANRTGILEAVPGGDAGLVPCRVTAPGVSTPLSNEKVRVKLVLWRVLYKSDAVCAMTG